MADYDIQLMDVLRSIERSLKRIAHVMETEQNEASAMVLTPNGVACVPLALLEDDNVLH